MAELQAKIKEYETYIAEIEVFQVQYEHKEIEIENLER